jgi:hypothetical protein
MNLWKPTALAWMASTVVLGGYEIARANPGSSPPAVAVQPNMQAALGSLESALGYLNRAEHNKGGWRVAAINSTREAIAQTQAGINYAGD